MKLSKRKLDGILGVLLLLLCMIFINTGIGYAISKYASSGVVFEVFKYSGIVIPILILIILLRNSSE